MNPQQEIDHLNGVDTLFLKAEHSRRLMTVTSLWTFKTRLDSNLVYEALEKLCESYPRFSRVPRNEGFFKPANWTVPVGWKPQDNVLLHILDPTTTTLEKYCAEQVVVPFDYTKPLWELHAISGFDGDRCAFFWKAHHSLADGEGFIRSLLSTTSLGSTLKKLEEQSIVNHKRNNKNTKSFLPRHIQQLLPSFVIQLLSLLWVSIWQIYLLCLAVSHDLYSSLISVIPFVTRKDLYYEGLQSHEKEMAWSEDISIKDIKLVRQAFGGTLNDVMLAVITRCVKHYLEEVVGKRQDEYIKFIIPVSLRQPSDWRFCNVVSGAWGFFSMKDLCTKQLVQQVRTQMLAIKSSCGPWMLYKYFERVLGKAPGLSPPLFIYDHFCDIPHGVFTNVPGPTVPISFAGGEIQEYRTFPPQSGKGSIGIALISYCGKVSIGAIADVHRTYPGVAEHICDSFAQEFNFILEEAKMELSKK
ncbi:wax ester synthase-like acyl-CoA acyltransferase domain-containing protein [Gilbertella persicaria]|uniref:Uncharacterized protein n=1 Tax=Rhizopus stolonifer TaxID=4846 RepID=A0A367IZJ0_RHIST|nr:wax ester synthase-like acyl-CoA acyltransferase domain-containing protein [Gilbertella persicaria]KAI8091397.1 wax ester synthase-like acyl-CoA acyltransferase domain-containing protein [Gilbertella persicaria]RCH83105.1 hypothetical protein CU098_006045 [Rhizopus stolonifer]